MQETVVRPPTPRSRTELEKVVTLLQNERAFTFERYVENRSTIFTNMRRANLLQTFPILSTFEKMFQNKLAKRDYFHGLTAEEKGRILRRIY
jgi:hypothetical protein